MFEPLIVDVANNNETPNAIDPKKAVNRSASVGVESNILNINLADPVKVVRSAPAYPDTTRNDDLGKNDTCEHP